MCVCVRVFTKLHITTHSSPVVLGIRKYGNLNAEKVGLVPLQHIGKASHSSLGATDRAGNLINR